MDPFRWNPADSSRNLGRTMKWGFSLRRDLLDILYDTHGHIDRTKCRVHLLYRISSRVHPPLGRRRCLEYLSRQLGEWFLEIDNGVLRTHCLLMET